MMTFSESCNKNPCTGRCETPSLEFDNENEDYLDYPDYEVLSDVVFSTSCIKNERTGRCDTPRMAFSDDNDYISDDTHIFGSEDNSSYQPYNEVPVIDLDFSPLNASNFSRDYFLLNGSDPLRHGLLLISFLISY